MAATERQGFRFESMPSLERDAKSGGISAIARLCRCLVFAMAPLILGCPCISSGAAERSPSHQIASAELDRIACAVEGGNPAMERTRGCGKPIPTAHRDLCGCPGPQQ